MRRLRLVGDHMSRLAAARLRRYASVAVAVLAAVSLAPVSIAAPATFVGLSLPPYPTDCKVGEGAVLGWGPPYLRGYEHLICGSREFVVFMRLLEQRDGKPYWTVVDEVQLPLSPGQRMMGVLTCSRPAKSGDQVFALGILRNVSGARFVGENVTHAWRFDLEAERIEPISPNEVSCEEENED